MQRKVLLSVALIICLASYAQAALSIVVGDHSYVQGTGVVTIPILVSGSDLVHGTDLSVQLGGTSNSHAALGVAPPITYAGSEQYNQPTPGADAPLLTPALWDVHANTWGDSTDGFSDGVPSIPGSTTGPNPNPPNNTMTYGDTNFEGTWFSGSLTFNASSGANATTNPNGLVEVNLKVNLTGFGPGTWTLYMLNGASGPTDFVNLSGFVTTSITDGSVTITAVPEPTSVVLGLFAAAGLGIVAIRKRRARRA